MIQINSTDVINSVSKYPLSFTVAGAPATALTADTMHIGFIGNWKVGDASLVRGAMGRASTKQVLTIDAAALTVVPPTVDEYLNISLRVNTTNHESLYARFLLVAGDTKNYQVLAKSALAGAAFAGDILTQIHAAFIAEESRFNNEGSPFTMTLAGGVLTLTAQDEHIYLEGIDVVGEDFSISNAIVMTTVQTAAQFEGVNTGLYIQENVRLLTYPSTMPYGIAQDQLVLDTSDLYRMISWYQTTERDELNVMGVNGGEAKSKINHVLYVRENASNALGIGNYVESISIFLSKQDVAGTIPSTTASFKDASGAVIADIGGQLPNDPLYSGLEAAVIFAV